jgi:tRNA-dihydrouridine synthase B
LAPMSGVSDVATRSIARRWGSDITFSEFISVDALHYKPGNEKSFQLAKFIEEERPFIIQVFGRDPEHFATAVKTLTEKFRPDGFDVNFGCPARSVVNNGSGSCLFLEPALGKRIIETVKEASGGLPTSIKLRASFKHVPAMEFMRGIEGAPFECVTIHMRTYEQVHNGPANWDSGRELTDYLKPKGISLIVNGGINSGREAREALAYTGADGVMVAQAALGNPFIFAEIQAAINQQAIPTISTEDRLNTILAHSKLMLEHKGQRGIIEMRKHLLWYFKGFPGAADLRKQLSQIDNLPQLETILHKDAFSRLPA